MPGETDAATDARKAVTSGRPGIATLDLRSLSLFRLLLGVVVLAHLAKAAISFSAHYTDAGVLPRALAARVFEHSPLWGLFYAFDGEAPVIAGMLLAGLSALAVIVGYHTRVALLLSWWLIGCLAARNPVVTHTGDDYLLVILLWSFFLPLDRHWSLGGDRVPKGSSPRHRSIASVAFIGQVFVFYVMAGALKAGYPVWRGGHALGVFLQIDSYVRPLGAALANSPSLLRAGTYATFLLECGLPWLVWLPVVWRWPRPLMLAGLASLHVALLLVASIGVFQWLCLAVLVALIPEAFWEAAWGERLSRLLDRPLPGRGAAQRPKGSSLRYPRSLDKLACGVLLALSAASALSHFGVAALGGTADARLDGAARMLGLRQRWNVFTDIRALDTGWFLRVGQRADGSRVNLDTGAAMLEPKLPPKPADYAASFPNHNWRKYWGNISRPAYAPLLPRLGQYYCEQWRDGALGYVAIFHIAEPVRPDFTIGEARSRRLVLHRCDPPGSSRPRIQSPPTR